MTSTEEALAVATVRNHFGPTVAETARLLLASPGLPLSLLIQKATLFCEKAGIESSSRTGVRKRISLVRDALAVLLQHGIAYWLERAPTAEEEEEGVKGKIVYFVRTDKVLSRMRMPLYLGFVRRRFGDVGEAAIRACFERGRLTASQIFEAVLSETRLVEMDVTVDDAEACLADMAKSGLMHWAGKRHMSADRHEDSDSDDDVPINVVRKGSKRLRSPGGGRGTEESQNIAVGRRDHRLIVGAPTKRNDQDIWNVCYWHLNREFRNECCAIVVQGRGQNDLAIRILRAGLQIALDDEDCQSPSDDFETMEVDTDHIQKQLAEESGAISSHDFWDAVTFLIRQSPPFVVGIPENAPTKLRFIPGRLVSEARHKTLEDQVLSRYGAVGRRVFRALAIDGGMDAKTLAEKCMLPIKLVRENVFRMHRDRMVLMQEVPRSHDQQRASNWYYLWKVNTMSVYREMIGIMYKTMLNLFLVLQDLEEKHPAKDAEKKQLRDRKELILCSILRMDQSVMVMRDFGPITSSYFPARYRVIDGYLGSIKKRR